MIKKVSAYVLALASSYIIGVLLVSQFNLARIVELGFVVSVHDRFLASVHDLGGMLASYLPLMALALLIAFLFTGLLLSRFIKSSALLYCLAGFVALICVHIIMHQVFGMSVVAPTRTFMGLLSQGLAGAVGGYVYWRVGSGK